MGACRQQVFACMTCYEANKKLSGVCYACSIQCHTRHNIVELFTKRDFTCDCGTTKMKSNGCCTLRSTLPSQDPPNKLIDLKKKKNMASEDQILDIPSSSNVYNDNYRNLFCDCKQPYNPLDDSNMFQCIFGDVCGEEWYHEECIMGLRPGFMNRKPENITAPSKAEAEDDGNKLASLSEPGMDFETDNTLKKEEEDISNNVDDSDYEILPIPGFPLLDDFETIICWKCVEKYMPEMEILADELKAQKVYFVRSETLEERDLKLAPHRDENNDDDSKSKKRLKVDRPFTLFLTEDFKDQLINIIKENKPHTSKLIGLLRKNSFLYLDDPVYKPPEDTDDDNSSIFELGLKNLSKIPTSDAIEGAQAYEKIKSKLTEFLKPFAETNKIVTEDEVRGFFSKQMK
ncbi:hypothetical protein CANARDRAFT_176535 [[Candida] arabinofermentans NRRL YB-2248]|uniref:UBR-type domain-containing protein n=1 Tax=[Candida] arabinofermentans NRRL YB-2248 TaxID=983967 RepID=A0A1E4SZ07_9ASCO|nr:hypothetical protein CANARDRAFT_176535 [[Candida] arabinofermentans NRRL YB-2248]